MPKAFDIPKLPALPTLAAENLIYPNGDVEPIICSEGDLWAPVVVGNISGYYCVHKHKVVAASGTVYSPTGFECAGGKENNRKWRLSIRVLLPTGERGRTLGMWLVSHKLDHLIPQSSPRKSGSSYRSSDDNSGGRTGTGTATTSSGFGSQGTGSLTLTLPGRPSPEKRYRPNEDDANPSKDDASPSKMLKAFFNAPTGNSLNIPEPTPPPLSPNPADVIGNFMQHHLAIHSPPNPTSLGLGVAGVSKSNNTARHPSSPPQRNSNFVKYQGHTDQGATPTPMHTPKPLDQLQGLLLPLGEPPQLHLHSNLENTAFPSIVHHHSTPLGTFLTSHDAAEGIISNPLESFLTHDNNNNHNAMNGGAGNGAVISTGVPIYPSRVIGLNHFDPEGKEVFGKNNNNEKGGEDGKDDEDNDARNQEEPLLGRGARRKGGGEGLGSHRRAAVPVSRAPSPASEPLPRQPVYTNTPRPTAAALAAARAASQQHHVEAIAPLPFFRQDSGSSLDLARVFDYGDFSPGGGLTGGFTPLQRSPGGGSADWGGGVQSITFSLGGNNGGEVIGSVRGYTGPHCGRAQNNNNKSINNVEGGAGDAAKEKGKRSSDASDSSFSIGKSRPTSPPPEMLNVCTPEGEAAAEEAAKKTATVGVQQDINKRGSVGGVGGIINPLFESKEDNEEEPAQIRVGRTQKSVHEAVKKRSPRLAAKAAAETAAADGYEEEKEKDDDTELLSTEISSGSSNLGDDDVDEHHTAPKGVTLHKKKKEDHLGLHAEDSAVLDQRENADVQIVYE